MRVRALEPGRADGAMTDVFRSLRRDYTIWVFVGVLALLLAAYSLPIWSADALASHGPYYIDVLLILATVLACFEGRSRIRAPAARRFWDLLGIGFALWLISKVPLIVATARATLRARSSA